MTRLWPLSGIPLIILSNLIALSSFASTAKDITPAVNHGELVEARKELCNYILRALDAESTDRTPDQSRIGLIYEHLDLAMGGSSFGYFDRDHLKRYAGPESIEEKSKWIEHTYRPAKASENRRRLRALAYFQMFRDAALLSDDRALAKFLLGIRGLHTAVAVAIFNYQGQKEKTWAEELFRHIFDDDQISTAETSLSHTQEGWAALSLPTKRAFTEWLGQVFAEDIDLFQAISHTFDDNGKANVSVRRLLPDLEVSLKQYLRLHRGQDTPTGLTSRYYRGYGITLLPLFGISYVEDDPLGLPPPRPALVEQVSRILKRVITRKP